MEIRWPLHGMNGATRYMQAYFDAAELYVMKLAKGRTKSDLMEGLIDVMEMKQ